LLTLFSRICAIFALLNQRIILIISILLSYQFFLMLCLRAHREKIRESKVSRCGEFGKNVRKPFPVPALWTYSFGTGTYTLRRRRHFAVIACDGGWRKRKREREREKKENSAAPF